MITLASVMDTMRCTWRNASLSGLCWVFAMPMPNTNASTSAVMTPNTGVISNVKNAAALFDSIILPVIGWMRRGSTVLPTRNTTTPDRTVVP